MRQRQISETKDTNPLQPSSNQLLFDKTLLPTGTRSLSSIGLQAFACGLLLATSLIYSTQLAAHSNPLWRIFAFFACLSQLHFLEYWTTAHFNTIATEASSFLLYSNGYQYNIAHSCAALEILVSHFVFPQWQTYLCNGVTITIGLFLVVLGQVVRSAAMATAGTNFAHQPARTRKDGHELVTAGIYGWFRHPSYFGFFWWALGTQLLVGNKVCFGAYAAVLWQFFSDRIRSEYYRENSPSCLYTD
jgi:protein-S-isoprenylcysteine O-methyltransferase